MTNYYRDDYDTSDKDRLKEKERLLKENKRLREALHDLYTDCINNYYQSTAVDNARKVLNGG